MTTSAQDTNTQTLRAGQDAAVKAFEEWTQTAKDAWASTSETQTTDADPQKVIDQIFDFSERMLAVQREFTKSVAASAASAMDSARQQSESVAGAVRQQAEATTTAANGATKTNK